MVSSDSEQEETVVELSSCTKAVPSNPPSKRNESSPRKKAGPKSPPRNPSPPTLPPIAPPPTPPPATPPSPPHPSIRPLDSPRPIAPTTPTTISPSGTTPSDPPHEPSKQVERNEVSLGTTPKQVESSIARSELGNNEPLSPSSENEGSSCVLHDVFRVTDLLSYQSSQRQHDRFTRSDRPSRSLRHQSRVQLLVVYLCVVVLFIILQFRGANFTIRQPRPVKPRCESSLESDDTRSTTIRSSCQRW